jgi:LacI family transcriptional regulator
MRSAVARRDEFLKSMAELGLTVPREHIVEGTHTMEGGIRATENLLQLPEMPTAIVCSNDMSAIGVLHGLQRTTHKVPDDVSVIGFDDIHLAQFVLPPLTTVQMSCRHLATAAVQALRAGIEPALAQSQQTEWPIPTHLVVRQSTTFPHGSLPALAKTRATPRRAAAKA